jgi:hypothetical protein
MIRIRSTLTLRPTEMVDEVGFAPLRTVDARLICGLVDCSIQKQVIDLLVSKLLDGFLSKSFDFFQMCQLQRQEGDGVRLLVVTQRVVIGLRSFDIATTQDEFVRRLTL